MTKRRFFASHQLPNLVGSLALNNDSLVYIGVRLRAEGYVGRALFITVAYLLLLDLKKEVNKGPIKFTMQKVQV